MLRKCDENIIDVTFLFIFFIIIIILLKTNLNPNARLFLFFLRMDPNARLKNTSDKTLLIQCSTPDARVQIPKLIRWKDITLPNEWLLEWETQPAKFASDEINLDYIQ